MKLRSTKRKCLFLLAFLFVLALNINGQQPAEKHAGTYTDHKKYPSTVLKLNSNGDFFLDESDRDFYMRIEQFENVGKWVSRGDTVILNPHLVRRNKTMNLEEKVIENFDSIRIELNYNIEEFGDSDTVNIYNFFLTTYEIDIDGERYYVIGRAPWETDINKRKNNIRIDENNSFCISKRSVEEIKVYEYSYGRLETFAIQSPESNYLRININHEFDKNRTPRNRNIIVKNNKAYLHQYSGKIDTSIFSLKLKKRKD